MQATGNTVLLYIQAVQRFFYLLSILVLVNNQGSFKFTHIKLEWFFYNSRHKMLSQYLPLEQSAALPSIVPYSYN